MAIDLVLDFLQNFPSRVCKCQNDVNHCSSGIFFHIPDVVLASLIHKLYLVFADSDIFATGLFFCMLSLISVRTVPPPLSFSLGRVTSFSWQVLVGLFLNLLTVFLSLFSPLHYNISLTLIPACVFSYQLVTEYFHLFFCTVSLYCTPVHLIVCLPCLS